MKDLYVSYNFFFKFLFQNKTFISPLFLDIMNLTANLKTGGSQLSPLKQGQTNLEIKFTDKSGQGNFYFKYLFIFLHNTNYILFSLFRAKSSHILRN